MQCAYWVIQPGVLAFGLQPPANVCEPCRVLVDASNCGQVSSSDLQTISMPAYLSPGSNSLKPSLRRREASFRNSASSSRVIVTIGHFLKRSKTWLTDGFV